MNSFTRRKFLKTSALAAGAAAFSAHSWGQVAGANSDIRVAVLGLNGRGRNHVSGLATIKGVRVVALCDPDSAVLERAKKMDGIHADSVKTYVDLRELFAASDIDAVTIATPNHWHSLASIWALQAGKDVYVEKPISHNVWEGRQLVAAAKKYNQRVVQAGTQIRSGDGMNEAVAWVRAGNLGKVIASRGFCYKRRDSIGKTSGPQEVPASINYDLWTGPAPLVPPHRKTRNGPVHYDWHWIWNYGNGDVGNQGIHQMDVARWFLGESGLPRHTFSVGGRLGYVDDGETPNTQVVVHEYASAPLIFEVRGLPAKPGKIETTPAGMNSADAADAAAASMDKYHGVTIGNVVDCEGGRVVVRSYWAADAFDREGKKLKEFRGHDRHMENFIDVVRSRKMADLRGPIDEGHLSSALCHLGNISHQVGHAMSATELAERSKGDSVTAEATGRMVEHLKVHSVDLTKTPLTAGATLTFDDKKECFVGEFAKAANPLLTRDYRKPYVVPQLA